MDRDRIVARAEKLVAVGKIEQAIEQYELLIRDNPNDVVTLNRIGDLWAKIGQTGSAVSVFRRIADYYAREGFYLKAIAILKKVNRLEPGDVTACALLADLYARQGLVTEARSQYAVVAEYYVRQRNFSGALMALRKSHDLDEQDIETGARIAELLAHEGQQDESAQMYHRLVRGILRRSGPTEVLRVVRSAMKHHPQAGPIACRVGEMLVEQKHLSLAVEILEEANGRTDVEPATVVLLARALVASGEIDRARSVLDRALEHFPDHETIRRNLAGLALFEGDNERALQLVGSLLAQPPEGAPLPAAVVPDAAPFEVTDDPDTELDDRLAEADVFASYGLSEPAVERIEQVLEQSPDYPPAVERLLRLALTDHRIDEAIMVAARLLPILHQRGLVEEAARVQEDLRRRELLDAVMASVELPPIVPETRFDVVEEPLSAEAEALDLEIELEVGLDIDVVAAEAAVPFVVAEQESVPAEVVEPEEVEAAGAEAETLAGDSLSEQIEGVQKLIARRKITRAAKLLDELLLEHPEDPSLLQVRDGLRTRGKKSGRKTAPGEPLANALLEGDRDHLDVN